MMEIKPIVIPIPIKLIDKIDKLFELIISSLNFSLIINSLESDIVFTINLSSNVFTPSNINLNFLLKYFLLVLKNRTDLNNQ